VFWSFGFGVLVWWKVVMEVGGLVSVQHKFVTMMSILTFSCIGSLALTRACL